MPPKDKCGTTLSPSASNKDTNCPVQFVKGVGPRLGAVFKSRGILTVKDLLTFFPRAYEDRTRILQIGELKENEKATVAAQVISCRKIPIRSSGRTILEVRVRDGSGVLSLKWFHAPRGMEKRFAVGAQLIASGIVKFFMNQPQIVHPEITWGVSSSTEIPQLNAGRVVPIYTEIEGVPSRQLRKILWEALGKFGSLLTEDLPERLLRKHGLPTLSCAIRSIHFPEDTDSAKTGHGLRIDQLVTFRTPAHWRLIYEEFFKFEYLVLKQRLRMERASAIPIGKSGGQKAVHDLTSQLPFKLTGDQDKAVKEILQDISQPHPMNRLIQGDVGSGKTAVALLTVGAVVAEGGQAALMAPTEILAEQHYKNTIGLFEGCLNAALLTGKTTISERAAIQKRLTSGEPLLLIGTHALLEDPVLFRNLNYVLIDEQHRFGVEQRRILRMKGTYVDPDTGKKVVPHMLILTATPIPRTLALTAYGDLAVSTIREMPPGRSPVITQVVRGEARSQAYEKIRDELRKGHQAYFIYPLVHDSEAEGFTQLRSAVAEAGRLSTEVFPEFKIGLLHGQLRPDEKTTIMERFKRKELDVLVSTTVIEVGVDVPNATVMAVEHADRFGLSQLHQLRGRVGRGKIQSYCFLFAAKNVGENTEQRLDVLEKNTDGFQIAEADLEIRGPGEFLGTRQAGSLPFRLAQLIRDREWLLKARDDVQELLRTDPDLLLPENAPLRSYYQREGNLQYEWLKTS